MSGRPPERTSITYRLPGGLRVTYGGTPKPWWRWLRGTWIGAVGVWRMWLWHAWRLVRNGHPPHPRLVTAATIGTLRKIVEDARGRQGD